MQWLIEQSGASRRCASASTPASSGSSALASHGCRPPSSSSSRSTSRTSVASAGLRALRPASRHLRRAAASRGLWPRRSFAVPLYGFDGREDVPAGVLLAAPVHSELVRDARWVRRPARAQARTAGAGLMPPRTSERRVCCERMLLDAVPDPILLTDTEGRLLLANARAAGALRRRRARERRPPPRGRPQQHAVLVGAGPGRRCDERAGRAPRAAARRPRGRVGPALRAHERGRRAIRARAACIVSILRNVTDLRRATEEIEENYRKLRVAEAAARAERDRLDLIIDSVADPILVTDPTGAIVDDERARRSASSWRPPDAHEETTRRIGANDAHFSSFVSNLFFGGEAPRRQGGVGLVDPDSGATCPWRRSPARSSPSTARSAPSSPSCTTAPRRSRSSTSTRS